MCTPTKRCWSAWDHYGFLVDQAKAKRLKEKKTMDLSGERPMSRSVFLGQVVINEFKEGEMLGVRVFIDSVCIYQQMPSTISDGMEALKRYVTQRWFDSAKPQETPNLEPLVNAPSTGNKCAKCGRGTFGALCARCVGEKVPPDMGGRALPYPK